MQAAAAIVPEERQGLEILLTEIARLETIFEHWDETQHNAVRAYAGAIEALHGEALKRLVKALKSSPAALTAMKGALADEVVYAVLRKHQIIKAGLAERIELALSRVRPMLASHGGDVDLVKIEPPSVHVRFTGACDGCPASMMTFHEGVKKSIEEACPEITQVVQVKGAGAEREGEMQSPFAGLGIWRFAIKLDELVEGAAHGVVVEGHKLLLAKRNAQVTCFKNACAHLGLTLDGGEVKDGILECPHHGFQYDLSSGECLTAPAVQLEPQQVRVAAGNVEVRLAR
jgi:Fe-S cluster biogenesis protein NfuA/nitrite reductase/ring-hydroxylating ferredoxin subunit